MIRRWKSHLRLFNGQAGARGEPARAAAASPGQEVTRDGVPLGVKPPGLSGRRTLILRCFNSSSPGASTPNDHWRCLHTPRRPAYRPAGRGADRGPFQPCSRGRRPPCPGGSGLPAPPLFADYGSDPAAQGRRSATVPDGGRPAVGWAGLGEARPGRAGLSSPQTPLPPVRPLTPTPTPPLPAHRRCQPNGGAEPGPRRRVSAEPARGLRLRTAGAEAASRRWAG